MRIGIMVLAALVGTVPEALSAQSATVSGTIRDQDGRALDGASIEILGTSFRATTTAPGTYQFSEVPAGQYWLLARRIGYTPIRITATVTAGTDRDLPFALERLPRSLSELTVLADGGMTRHRYQDFVARSHSAFGSFLTRDDIASYSGNLIELAQAHLPGRSRYTLEQRLGSGFRAPGGNLSRLANANCAPAVSFNGARPLPGLSLADFKREDVEALEVYRRGNWVPTEFASSQRTGCGLIVVWGK